jgi:hypothetical protein
MFCKNNGEFGMKKVFKKSVPVLVFGVLVNLLVLGSAAFAQEGKNTQSGKANTAAADKASKNKAKNKGSKDKTGKDKKSGPDKNKKSADNSPASNSFVIDTIKAVIMSEEGTEIITLSDVNRPSLTGAPRTIEDMVFESEVFLQAKKHQILPGDKDIDGYLAGVMQEHNLTAKQLEEIFAQSGYTMEEGREEFRKMHATNSMIEYKIRSNLIIPKKRVEEYYEQNPEYAQDRYLFEYAAISFDSPFVVQGIINPSLRTEIPWESSFWLSKDEVAEDKLSMLDLAVGEISRPYAGDQGWQLYRLKEKQERRLKTLDERYTEIAALLRKPRYLKLVEEYKEFLGTVNSVFYF